LGLLLLAQLFLDACRATAALPQVVQLGATHRTATLHFNLGDAWAVQRESALDTLAVGDLAHDETGVQATVATGNHHAFVSLHTLARAFDNVHADNNGVAGRKLRNFYVQTSNFFLL